VVDAAAARLPLVVITADRPPELHGCEAPQTIDQQRLYGGFVRRFVDLGAPAAELSCLRAVRRAVGQAVASTTWPEPGPVHINAPARKPLEPARLDAELAERPARGSRVQLVTVSFDPTNDPPERMAALRRSLEPRGRWRFATAPSEAAMTPVLEDFGQDARPSHVLKIFLVDGQGQVRNVYSTGFLDLRILLADLETLLGP
jgi:2-succinyl-5-enolpyruvyl-6-hydroxy-3-cyclohexene-1-carboxylate synthase